MRNDPDSGFLAPSDIADLAGVSRAAVSNWRRRELDFPPPVGGTKANPLFDRFEVERWLGANRSQDPRADRASAGLAMWSVTNGFRQDLPMQVIRTLALSVLCARKLTAGREGAEDLFREASEGRFLQVVDLLAAADGADERWRQLVTVDPDWLDGLRVDRLAIGRLTQDLYGLVAAVDVDELAKAGDYVVNRATSTEGRTAGEHGAVKSRMSRLLADVGSAGESPIVASAYDPACGIGEALIEFWLQSPHRNQLALYGTEVDEHYARICRQRCFLYGAEVTVECGDVLARDPLPDLKADVVIAEPPFGLEMPPGFRLADPRWALAGPPPKGNADTAWLQHVIAHLTPEGLGLVVTGLGATSAPNTTGIRRSLVLRDCIDTVVVLPRKLLTYTPIATALWIVRAPDRPEAAHHLTFIDASQLEPSEKFDLRIMNPEDWAEDNPKIFSARVASEHVLADEPVRLDPRHWTRTVVDRDEIVDRHHTATSVLDHAIDTIAATDRATSVVAPASRTITVRELEKQGALNIIRGGKTPMPPLNDSALANPDPSPPWVVTRRMIRDGLPTTSSDPFPSMRAGVPLSDAAMPEIDESYTRPGDILVTTSGAVRAIVDEKGGWVPGGGVSRVVLNPQHLQPHYVAECLNSSWNQPAESGSPMSVMLRDLEIPLIALDDQIRLAGQIKQARELAETGKLLVEASEELIAAQLDAIRYDVNLGAAFVDGS